MPVKTVELPDIGTIQLHRRKGSRHVRLSINNAGKVRVTMPYWLPYQAGIEFARSKADWIARSRPAQRRHEIGGQVGKYHRLRMQAGTGSRVSARVTDTEVRLTVPLGIGSDSPAVQEAIQRAAIKALIKQAESVLPERLSALAELYGFSYKSVAIKRLQGRWGSCNHHKEIVLNCYLMQLPWELIDYVIIHELVHTRILAHGPRFWDEMAQYFEDLPSLRKRMRSHRPVLIIEA